jgi:cation:H+ antiporter
VSAFNWARQQGKAKLGLMNFCSSNVNQMTMLVAMIPIVYAVSKGSWNAPILFDAHQKEEVLLTGCQAALCMVLLFNMKFEWWDATGMFALWAAQFFFPNMLRGPIVWVYLGWIALEIFLAMVGVRKWSFPLRIGKDTARRGETSRRERPSPT